MTTTPTLHIDWQLAANIATALAGTAALLGGPFAYFTYRRSVRTRRAEWLASLHEKFFEGDRYANIRRVLDYRPEPEYSSLVSAVTTGTHAQLADELYRYLNFFELLSGLRELGEISDKEIVGLFDYDLRMLTTHEFIMNCLEQQGFERLPKMLQHTKILPRR